MIMISQQEPSLKHDKYDNIVAMAHGPSTAAKQLSWLCIAAKHAQTWAIPPAFSGPGSNRCTCALHPSWTMWFVSNDIKQ